VLHLEDAVLHQVLCGMYIRVKFVQAPDPGILGVENL
jgi:hypothetical protein